MEKRAVIAVVLSIAFFYFFSAYFAPQKPAVTPVQKPVSSAVTAVRTAAPAVSATAVPAGVASAPSVEQEIRVDTPLYSAVFSSRGGTLKHLMLKGYKESPTGDSRNITLVDARQPAEYLFATSGEGLAIDSQALYVPSLPAVSVADGEKKELSFSWQSPQGITIRKVFRFAGNGYGIELEHQVINSGAQNVSGKLLVQIPRLVRGEKGTGRFEVDALVASAKGDFVTRPVADLPAKPEKLAEQVAWAGFTDKYFLTAILSGKTPIASVATAQKGAAVVEAAVASPSLTVAPGQQSVISYDLYLGPKDIDLLKAQGRNLEQALDLGWFSALAMPLLEVLKYFYRYTHNYGIAIIIITVILKVLFFPLTYKSYKSMKEMQKIQPLMTKLREKYKNDREKMNMEIMKLYQEHKVNPLGGCFPMLIQIPVFFALYKALMFSIELRHAPFALWITDLSAKDPYYVTPIIMGITMVIQQKMTPSQMDPIQQKMMMALPVVFTFMFLGFPSGLVLYWLVNNVLTIGQQWYINRQIA